ncbi:MAG: VWA domain-containing protein [Treponema sp.]|nr:VWA domain-containing protein [Treponema sp.]
MFTQKINRVLTGICLFILPHFAFSSGFIENNSLTSGGANYAQQGKIIPPGEINTAAYISAGNYQYPQAESNVEIHTYPRVRSPDGGVKEGFLHIGIKGQDRQFSELAPMNLVFVVDVSQSMQKEGRLEWVKEALIKFTEKVRSVDSLALVSFNEKAEIRFAAALIETGENRQGFLTAVNSLSAAGVTDLEAGLTLGYEQSKINYRPDGINAVLLLSDGTDLSARLVREQAMSGDIRISLSWSNRNDLDLHVVTPLGEEIYFNRMRDSTGGIQDVDMNVDGESSEPVENIFWGKDMARSGDYRVYVQNYSYFEDNENPTPFQVEVKNGDDYKIFEGRISGTGRSSNTDAGVFTFGDTNQVSSLFQLAENYRAQGITIAAFGVGVDFDPELIQNLALRGGGHSRFLNDREKTMVTFSSDEEFKRIAVITARGLELKVDFMPGIEIAETWGYNYKIENNSVSYQLPVLNMGEDKIILIHYRVLPPASNPGAALKLSAGDSAGNPAVLYDGVIGLGETSAAEQALSMARQSETRMRIAGAFTGAGERYYRTGGDRLSALRSAAGMAAAGQNEIQTARGERNDPRLFNDEYNLLARYLETINGELPAEDPIESLIAANTISPVSPRQVTVTVIPGIPNVQNGRTYTLQVGSYQIVNNAQDAHRRLQNAGFTPAYEQFNGYTRVVIPNVRSAEAAAIINRIGAAGFYTIWVREVW